MYGLEALSLPAHRDRCETSKLYTDTAKRKDRNATPVKMQHRHFATIAKLVATLPEKVNRLTVARHFATQLAATNPNFDRQRFLNACQPDDD